MNPIYKFTLTANGGAERVAFPVYRDDLAKDFEQQSNQQFFRAKLAGKLTFVRDDYDFIVDQRFDTQFGIKIYISYNNGQTWALYWSGSFWKTNCTFDDDNKNLTLTPDVVDQYTDVLAGMEKEYNLIELAPAIVPVKLDKRPMIQMYVPGQSVISCFLSGMYWEQECEAESNTAKLIEQGDRKLNFAFNKSERVIDVTQKGSPEIPDFFNGTAWNGNQPGTTEYTNGDYLFQRYYFMQSGSSVERFCIYRVSDRQLMWFVQFENMAPRSFPGEFTLAPVSGSGATGNVVVYIHDLEVYARYICDTPMFGTVPTYELGDDDIVTDNRNYSRVVSYSFPSTVFFSSNLSDSPTQWGLYKPGKYYQQPAGAFYYGEFYPVSRNAWGSISIWFAFYAFDWIIEQRGRKEFTLKDSYPLASVISVLLAKVAPNLTHSETTEYSQFLYGTNPLYGINQRILITPKSNMITLGYDQPAQKAPITLKRVLDMLRDCFRCYCFVDEQNRFRIEHVSFFMNGGAYPGTPNFPVIGRDLTNEKLTRNNRYAAFGTSQYQFDKPEMSSRYQFGWMDDVTQLFEGNPLEIISKYVNPDKIEQIDVSHFTSDVDYILLNPGEISKDGFVLMAATEINELESPETYTIDETGYARLRYPVPNDWLGKTIRVTANVTANAPVTLTAETFGGGEDVTLYSGTNNVVLNVPSDSTQLIFEGVVGASITVTYIGAGNYKLPYHNFEIDNISHYLQNAYVSFAWLEQYYFFDMPASDFQYNGQLMRAQGIKKLKTQKLNFFALTDPNVMELIKTYLGNGTIQKMSVNLSSRNAQTTLKYDTE